MGAHESKAMEHAGLASRPPQQWTPAELERFLLADPETSTHAAAVRRLKIDGKTAVSLLLTHAVGHGAVPTTRSLGSAADAIRVADRLVLDGAPGADGADGARGSSDERVTHAVESSIGVLDATLGLHNCSKCYPAAPPSAGASRELAREVVRSRIPKAGKAAAGSPTKA